MATPNISIEEWRPVPGWERLYSASSMGRIRREPAMIFSTWGPRLWAGRIMKPTVNRGEQYLRVVLRDGGRRVKARVHTLIALTFIGPRPHDFHVNHIDGTKLNNAVSNLEYLSPGDNLRHALRTGLMCHNFPSARLTTSDVHEIRAATKGPGWAHVFARRFGVSVTSIYRARSYTTWSHR